MTGRGKGALDSSQHEKTRGLLGGLGVGGKHLQERQILSYDLSKEFQIRIFFTDLLPVHALSTFGSFRYCTFQRS